jgi:hypothetical protein
VVLDCLAAQGVHGILSSALLAGLPGWVPGIPAQLPAQWIDRQGDGQVAGDCYPGDLRAAQAEPRCALPTRPAPPRTTLPTRAS